MIDGFHLSMQPSRSKHLEKAFPLHSLSRHHGPVGRWMAFPCQRGRVGCTLHPRMQLHRFQPREDWGATDPGGVRRFLEGDKEGCGSGCFRLLKGFNVFNAAIKMRVTMASRNVQTRASIKHASELAYTAKRVARRGRGILASDESNATTGKRLATVGLENTEETRRQWRELLYTAPGLGQYISGAILFEDTLHQSTSDGRKFISVLEKQDIVVGIKVDSGLQPIAGTDGETATQGLDGLADRCAEFYKMGARFAKWRAVLKVGEGCPSSTAILENAHGLARYAQICQDNGLVPIVEPEVTLGPGDYSIERTAYESEKVYSHVFRLLNEYGVMLEGILLKPNMILPGLDAPVPSPEEVAEYTVRTMKRTIPAAVPGIHFLSGGMSEEEATLNLQALQGHEGCPWSLTFSYGRALQNSTLNTWGGKPENVKAAQDILLALAKANSEAQLGEFKGPHPVPGGGRILQALRLGGAGK